jgi:hypothetical protein
MASLLRPTSSSFRLSSSPLPASPPISPSRRRKAPPAPLAFPAPPSRPRAVAAAAYGGGGAPVDTQTFIIAASVVGAVSLSLVLGLKVWSPRVATSWSSSSSRRTDKRRVAAAGSDFVSFSFAGGPCSVRTVCWKWYSTTPYFSLPLVYYFEKLLKL